MCSFKNLAINFQVTQEIFNQNQKRFQGGIYHCMMWGIWWLLLQWEFGASLQIQQIHVNIRMFVLDMRKHPSRLLSPVQ